MAREKQKLPLRSPSEVSARTGCAVLLDNLPIIRERYLAVAAPTNSLGDLIKAFQAAGATVEGQPIPSDRDTVVDLPAPEQSEINRTITSARSLRAQVDEALHYAQMLGDWSLHAELDWVSQGLMAVSQHVRDQPELAAASLSALRARVTRLLELPTESEATS